VRVKPTGRNIFGSNIITWQGGDIKRLTEVEEGVDAAVFVLEPNLWWSNETLDQRRKLSQFPFKQPTEQILDLDPKLDKALKATEPRAQAYGVG